MMIQVSSCQRHVELNCHQSVIVRGLFHVLERTLTPCLYVAETWHGPRAAVFSDRGHTHELCRRPGGPAAGPSRSLPLQLEVQLSSCDSFLVEYSLQSFEDWPASLFMRQAVKAGGPAAPAAVGRPVI